MALLDWLPAMTIKAGGRPLAILAEINRMLDGAGYLRSQGTIVERLRRLIEDHRPSELDEFIRIENIDMRLGQLVNEISARRDTINHDETVVIFGTLVGNVLEARDRELHWVADRISEIWS